MFLSNLPPSIKVHYDKESKNYVAYYSNSQGDRIGNCSYGTTKKDALFNLQK
jgi:hypothetical protein